MASTRNLNTKSDYKIEQEMNNQESSYILNPDRLFAYRNSKRSLRRMERNWKQR